MILKLGRMAVPIGENLAFPFHFNQTLMHFSRSYRAIKVGGPSDGQCVTKVPNFEIVARLLY